MKKLLIIDNIWSPYAQARYTEIAKESKLSLTVFFQTQSDKFREWSFDDEKQKELFDVRFLKNISVPLVSSTALSMNLNYDVYSQIKHLDPDRIIVCGWDSLATLAAVTYAKRYKKEIILWAGSTIHEKSLIRTLTVPYVKFLLKMFDGFISYGTASADYLRQLGVRKEILHFYNTVDIDFFRKYSSLNEEDAGDLRKEYNIDSNSKIIIFSGRLVRIKRVDMLINVFLELEKTFQELELIIVGYGPEEGTLKTLAGDSPKIHFTGSKQPMELARLYGLSDILVLPSNSEPWGLVVNEAMASGCAVVVSTNCGCSVDLVKDNGIVFDTDNPESLRSALSGLISIPDKLNEMKAASLREIENFKPGKLILSIPYFLE